MTDTTQAQLARKAQSESRLAAEGIPVNPALPCLPSEEATVLRSTDEVLDRALALCFVSLKGDAWGEKQLEAFYRDYLVADKLSTQERRFRIARKPPSNDMIRFAWRAEALLALLWALNLSDDLPFPDDACDLEALADFIAQYTESELREAIALRPLPEILDMADLTFRYDQASLEARINGQDMPAKLSPGVLYERHYAFSWLTNASNRDWDEVLAE